MKNNGLSQRRRENRLAFVAVHWGDSSNARHAIPPDVDVLKTSGGKKRSLGILCVLKRSGREMLVTLCDNLQSLPGAI